MTFDELIKFLKEKLNVVVFEISGSDFTLLTLVYVIVATILLIYLSKLLSRSLDRKILYHRIPEQGNRTAIVTIIKYIFLVAGFLFIFKSAGFHIGAFGWAVGALGVGIGFGLQNITNNFISGIIILFERPIKVGDRIEVSNISGDVVAINIRSTTVLTNDNISVIVPNSEFINKNVINWSHNDRKVRFRFPIGVSYNEDPAKVKEVVLNVARKHTGILPEPAPDLWFIEYADSSLNFELVVWSDTFVQRPVVLKSQLYYELFSEFAKNNIEIPFPQRDIHIKTTFPVNAEDTKGL